MGQFRGKKGIRKEVIDVQMSKGEGKGGTEKREEGRKGRGKRHFKEEKEVRKRG